MKKKSSKHSAFFEPRVFISFLLLFGASLLALTGFGISADAQGARPAPIAPVPSRPVPDVVRMVGAVSQDRDLRDLPYIEARGEEEEDTPMQRYPFRRGQD